MSGLQGIPRLDTPMVREGSGAVAIPWHQFFIELWQRTGGEFVPVGDQVALQLNSTSNQIEAVDTVTGVIIGVVLVSTNDGVAAVPIPLTGSPQVYIASVAGTLVVFAAQTELSRNGGATWFTVSATGGALPLLAGDRARVTWGAPPVITFFPSSA